MSARKCCLMVWVKQTNVKDMLKHKKDLAVSKIGFTFASNNKNKCSINE